MLEKRDKENIKKVKQAHVKAILRQKEIIQTKVMQLFARSVAVIW
ncbi:MAG: hypothetical protein WBV93_15205 [Anaerobacillus sp.]